MFVLSKAVGDFHKENRPLLSQAPWQREDAVPLEEQGPYGAPGQVALSLPGRSRFLIE